MQQIFYIEIDGKIWKLHEDGRIEPLTPGEVVPDGVEIIGLKDLESAAIGNDSQSSPAANNQRQSLSSNIRSTNEGGSGSYLSSVYSNLNRDGDEVLADAGWQTVGLPDPEQPNEPDYQSQAKALDSNAAITIFINDDNDLADNYVNRFENSSVDFFGNTEKIDDDWAIELTLIDSSGRVFSSESSNLVNVWELLNQDLSALTEGPFTATATARDIYGNFVTDSANSIKDTLAEGIDVSADTGNDALINLFEAANTELSGQFDHVQAGAEVLISVTDSSGKSLNFTAPLDADGSWTLNEDLRSFKEGTLRLHAETIDLAGNPAETDSSVELSLSPQITLENPDKDDRYDDDIYNQFESADQLYFGTVFNVEDGQTVTVTIDDQNGLTVIASTTTSAGQWRIDNIDTSALADGPLNVTAEVFNRGGEAAIANLNRNMDQTADLNAEFVDPNTDGVYNALEALAATLRGIVTDIEIGQPVFISVGDESGASAQGVGQVQSNNIWVASDLDLSIATGGLLTMTLNVEDKAGNPATATATIDYDPFAVIGDSAVDNQDGDRDQLFNAAEVATGITLEGSTDNIESGQLLTVTITDGSGKKVVVNDVPVQGATGTLVNASAGTWQTELNDVDLSSLDDGDLNVVISGEDVADNRAIATDTIHKDTVATINVRFDGDTPNDNKFSASEISAVSIGGTTADIEPGRMVDLVISGLSINGLAQADISFQAKVQDDGSYSSLNNDSNQTYDLSGYDDSAALTVTANVSDLAGNPASASDTASKDTVLNIDIDTGANGLDIAQIRASTTTTYSGTTDTEENQQVTLTFSDGSNQFQTKATVNNLGQWQTAAITPTGLSLLKAWTLTATVDDQSGNSASDDTPTLIKPEAVILSESKLSTGTKIDTEITPIRIEVGGNPVFNDQPFTFSAVARQTALGNIRSLNSDTSVQISNDGKSLIVVRDSDGARVLEAKINDAAKTVTVTLREVVEQAGGDSLLLSKILLQATQNDIAADPNAEMVEAPIDLVIRDNASDFLVDDIYQVIEDTATSSNLFNNDNLGEGPLTLVSVNYNNTVYPVAAGSSTVINTDEGQLTVNSDGSWTLVAARDQNNATNNPVLNFSYTASDSDGDLDSADVLIEVIDGALGTVDAQQVTTTELDYLSLGSTIDYPVTINAGSDNLDADSFALKDDTLVLLRQAGFESGGVQVNYSLSVDGKTLTASAASATVFTFKLNATQSANGQDIDGIGKLTWFAPLDHDNSQRDELQLRFIFTASDSDGTAISPTTATLTLIDGKNPSLTTATKASLDEDNVGPAVETGSAAITIGSDTLKTLAFADTGSQPAITSNGDALIYVLENAQTLVGYITDSSVPGNEIIRVVLDDLTVLDNNSQLTYTVTLSRALDQPNTPGLNDGVLQIPFAVKVSDFDGDTSDGTLVVAVSDSDAAIVSDVVLHTSEAPAKLGSGLTQTSTALIDIDANQDKLVAVQFNVTEGTRVEDNSGNKLDSNGSAIYWHNAGGGILQGRLNDGTLIFSITLPSSLSVDSGDSQKIPVTLEVLGSIDHNTSVTDTAVIDVSIKVIDSDNTASGANLQLQINDGRDPQIFPTLAMDVAEANIAAGTADDSAVIYGTPGSDLISTINVVLLTTALSTSDNRAITLQQTSSTTWQGEADNGSGGTDVIFTLKVARNGQSSFELLGPIKHAAPVGVPADNNLKTLEFQVEGVDADGDSTGTQTLRVNVTDDIPTSPVYDPNNIPELTEGETADGNLFTDANILTQGNFGADGGDIFEVRYDGGRYRFDDDGSGDPYLVVNNPIIIPLTEFGRPYGTVTIQSDGSYEMIADDVFNLVGINYTDQINYDFWDNDGDASTDNVYKFRVADAEGSMSLSPRTTNEDIPLTLNLKGNPGDLDNGEKIVRFAIEKAALNGGVITLAGIELGGDATYYYIESAQIADTNSGTPGEVKPGGELIFIPALHASNQTQTVKIKIDMSVQTNTGPHIVNDTFKINVTSVADAPEWDVAGTYSFSIDEDSGKNTLSPAEAALVDTDSSETLSYKLVSKEVGFTLFSGGRQINIGNTMSAAEFSALQADPDFNISGSFDFVIEAISTEAENSDQASAQQTFTVEIKGVADEPTLTVRNLQGTEDVAIAIKDAISGELTDTDGSEVLWFKLTLPNGWSIDNAPNIIPNPIDGSFLVSWNDISAGATLIPKEDLSQVTEIPTIKVQAVSLETVEDGVNPDILQVASPEKSFNIKLKGVADKPLITPGDDGNWSYDDASGVISATTDFNEDSRIALNFGVDSQDDDGSEKISLHLSGLPEGSQLFNGAGDELFLPVFDASNPNNPVYTITRTQLADLFFEAPEDFSGKVVLQLEQINTEPDGDSAAFDMSIEFVVAPVIDTADNQVIAPDIEPERDNENGLEDTTTPVVINPELADIDGSETLTEVIILPGFEGTLSFDGNPLTVPVGGLVMSDLATTEGISLNALLTGGRLGFQAPEDRHGNFNISFTYQVTDTNGGLSPDTVVDLDGTLVIDVRAQVDHSPTDLVDTRLESQNNSVLISDDGTAISLEGQLQFFEEDLDGSEVIDYVLLKMPDNSDWFVSQPISQAPPFYGAIHDGNGNWMLRAPTTSDSVQEQMLEILAGVTLSSRNPTASPVTIQVEVRVKDGIDDAHLDDAEILFGAIQVQFDQGIGTSIAHSPDNIVKDIVDGIEGTDARGQATMAEHIIDGLSTGSGNGVVGDADSSDAQFKDHISFRVDKADLPYGANLSGTDVRALYASDGTTLMAFVFGEPALQDLKLVNLNEDFAGNFDVPFNVIATDPSGDIQTDVQTFTFNIEPRVDNLDQLDSDDEPFDISFNGREDELVSLDYNYSSLLGDSDSLTSRGIENIVSMTFSDLKGGSFFDPDSLLVDNLDSSYSLSDPSKVADIYFVPPQHWSGDSLSIDVAFEITDTTSGNTIVGNQVTDTKSTTLHFDMEPVTDAADLCIPTSDVRGDEDSKIDITGLCAELIDQDGSETISIQITGVPEGAVLFSGSNQLPNNGTDGGVVSGGDLDGTATYSWTVTQAQLATLSIQPPQDFSGDLALNIEAITHEKGTSDFKTTSASFTVGVDPVADGVQLTSPQDSETGAEGSPINLSLGAEILENIQPNEVVQLKVTALSTTDGSDPQALIKLDRIIADGITGRFLNNNDGSYTATVTTIAATLASFTLIAGEKAWGNLQLQVDVSSIDNNTVLGTSETDVSAPESFNISIDIEPKPDPAILVRDYDGLITSNGLNLAMGLTVSQDNPAPGETTQLEISGLPADFSFNLGTQQGNSWIIDEADVSNLKLVTGTEQGEFTLQLQTVTRLDGISAQSNSQTMTIKVDAAGNNNLTGTNGDDYYEGATGNDNFIWSDEDQGTIFFPNHDKLADFNQGSGSYNNAEGDTLDMSGLLAGMGITDGTTAAGIMNVDDSSGSTVFHIKVDGAISSNQTITLDGVSMSDMVASYTDDVDFLDQLIKNHTLITQ